MLNIKFPLLWRTEPNSFFTFNVFPGPSVTFSTFSDAFCECPSETSPEKSRKEKRRYECKLTQKYRLTPSFVFFFFCFTLNVQPNCCCRLSQLSGIDCILAVQTSLFGYIWYSFFVSSSCKNIYYYTAIYYLWHTFLVLYLSCQKPETVIIMYRYNFV